MELTPDAVTRREFLPLLPMAIALLPDASARAPTTVAPEPVA